MTQMGVTGMTGTQTILPSAANRLERSVGEETVIAAAEVTPDFHDMILGLWLRSAKKDQHTADAAKVEDRERIPSMAWFCSLIQSCADSSLIASNCVITL